MSRIIDIFTPGAGYPSLSTTGTECSLSCAHCNRHYLKGMVDVSGPGSLSCFGRELEDSGGKGFLLSGGCDHRGKVVMPDHILRQISLLKVETDLAINVHPGLVDAASAKSLHEAGVDAASFDVIQDQRTIDEVLGIDAAPEDYERSYNHLLDAGIRVVPHVLAGLYYGKPAGERSSVDLISTFKPDTAVLITLIPTKGTRMEGVSPYPEEDLIELAGYMVDRIDGSLMLGCMRPRNYRDLEIRALEAGFSGIVSPGRRTQERIGDLGWKMRRLDICCAIPPL